MNDKAFYEAVEASPPRSRRERQPAPPKPKPASSKKADYTEKLVGLFQLPAGILAIAAHQTRNPILGADALALSMGAPAIAEAANDLAQEDEQFARIVAFVVKTGPYGKLLTALFTTGAQIAANHKRIPPGFMGTVPPEQLIAEFIGQTSMQDGGSGNGQASRAADGTS